MSQTAQTATATAEHDWLKRMMPYRAPNRLRGVFELVVTVIPLVALWVLTWTSLQFGFWWGLLLTIPAAGFLLRLFMIQHDCGHGSLLRRRQRQRLDRARHRRPYPHALRLLAAHPRRPPRLERQSRPARHRRRDHPDRRRVPRAAALEPLRLPALSPPARHVRLRPVLALRHPAPPARRPDARRRHALGIDDGHQRGASPPSRSR